MCYSRLNNRAKFAAVAFGALALATACTPDDVPMPPSTYNAERDVKLSACRASTGGVVNAQVKVTNHGTDTRSYLIVAEAVDDVGTRVAEINAAVNAVKPARTVTAPASGFAPGAVFSSCRVVNVQSFKLR